MLVSETLEWMYIYTSHSLGFSSDSEWLTFVEPFFSSFFLYLFCEKEYIRIEFLLCDNKVIADHFTLGLLVRVDTIEGVIIW